MIALLLVLTGVAGAMCVRLVLIVRGAQKQRYIAAQQGLWSYAPDAIGISVLCCDARSFEQITQLLAVEYVRYEVIVVLDLQRHGGLFARLESQYRMIRVESPSGEELSGVRMRSMWRSRKRCFRRLVLIDAPEQGRTALLDVAASVATYEYLLPVGEGVALRGGAIERFVAELGARFEDRPCWIGTAVGEPICVVSREQVVRVGGFGNLRWWRIPRHARRRLWERLSADVAARQVAIRLGAWQLLSGILLVAATGALIGGWWWGAALLSALLLAAVAGCRSYRILFARG